MRGCTIEAALTADNAENWTAVPVRGVSRTNSPAAMAASMYAAPGRSTWLWIQWSLTLGNAILPCSITVELPEISPKICSRQM
eukprot:scaffold120720_cov51-Prasinocladus_malaysianus.AAC.1